MPKGVRRTIAEELAVELAENVGELVERAIAVEAEILVTLAELKPGRALPSNVEYYGGVVMASVGVPREMFPRSPSAAPLAGASTPSSRPRPPS